MQKCKLCHIRAFVKWGAWGPQIPVMTGDHVGCGGQFRNTGVATDIGHRGLTWHRAWEPPCPVSQDTAVCEYASQDWCKCPSPFTKLDFSFQVLFSRTYGSVFSFRQVYFELKVKNGIGLWGNQILGRELYTVYVYIVYCACSNFLLYLYSGNCFN